MKVETVIFSIIVPVYKAETYLEVCLHSIQKQIFQNYEVILVDDGSPDGSGDICDQYAVTDPRFHVIHKKNEGAAEARKTGLDHAKGKYVIFIDADDWLEHQYLSEAEKILKQYPVDIISAGFVQETGQKALYFEDKFSEGIYEKGKLEKDIYPSMLYGGNFYEFGIWPAFWTKIFKREVIEKGFRKNDEKIIIGEDVAVVYPCLLEADSIYIWKKHFYHYRYVDTSVSQKKDDRFFDKVEILFRSIDEDTRLDAIRTQITAYKMYMILLATDRCFSTERNIRKAGKIVQRICEKALYSEVIEQFDIQQDVDWRLKLKINALKKRHYFVLLLYYGVHEWKIRLLSGLKAV